jgi:beta-phosphoglucomutase-like phosphatase (HAD superfamily)
LKKHIAIDLDGVVVDLMGAVCFELANEFGVIVDYDDITSWCGDGNPDNPIDKLTCFGKGRTWWDWLQERPFIWSDADAIPGAIGTISRLRQEGYYLEALSAKPTVWTRQVTWKWLGMNKPDFHRVTLVDHAMQKPRATSAQILIDDSPHGGQAWVNSGRDLIVFAQPWNTEHTYQSTSDGGCAYRASDWADVPRLLNLIEFVKEAEWHQES